MLEEGCRETEKVVCYILVEHDEVVSCDGFVLGRSRKESISVR
jgi:hypothetical protein